MNHETATFIHSDDLLHLNIKWPASSVLANNTWEETVHFRIYLRTFLWVCSIHFFYFTISLCCELWKLSLAWGRCALSPPLCCFLRLEPGLRFDNPPPLTITDFSCLIIRKYFLETMTWEHTGDISALTRPKLNGRPTQWHNLKFLQPENRQWHRKENYFIIRPNIIKRTADQMQICTFSVNQFSLHPH